MFTVDYMGWKGVTNGDLLALAAAAGFEADLTMDSGIEHEQNLKALPVAVVVIKAASNALDDIRPLVPALLNALATLPPNAVVTIGG